MEKDQRHPDRHNPTHPTQPNQQDDNTRRKGGEDRDREPMRTTEHDKDRRHDDTDRRHDDTKRPQEENDRNSL